MKNKKIILTLLLIIQFILILMMSSDVDNLIIYLVSKTIFFTIFMINNFILYKIC